MVESSDKTIFPNINATEIKNDDEIQEIELKLESLYSQFSEATNFVLSHSNIKKTEFEPDLSSSSNHEDRIRIEQLDQNKIANFQLVVNESSKSILNLFDDISESINKISSNEEYFKSEEELMNELKLLKSRQQSKIESLNKSIKLAKDSLESIEENQNYDMLL